MIAARLTHRAQIERDTSVATDSWGNPAEPDFQPVGDPVACFAWSTNSRQIVDGAKSALVEDVRALFALGTDIRAGDVLASVTDRRGAPVLEGRLRVDGPVQHKHTHLEAALERIA